MTDLPWTREMIWRTAVAQSALELNCLPEDLTGGGRTVALSVPNPKARRYLSLPFSCNIVSYGSGVVASASPEYAETARGYIERFPVEHLFETPNMHVLDEAVAACGMKVCFMAEYFLPDPELLKAAECPYEIRVLEKGAFDAYYLPEWSNALSSKRPELDVLCVGAFDEEKLVGLAGCSADCDSMWQIGIDVLPGYRRQGIASALTGRLALETLNRGKVPFYCAAWSNIASVRNAVRSGFRPAWAELTVKSRETVDGMNGVHPLPDTPRLRLRPYTRDDLVALRGILSDPETMKFYPAPYDDAGVRRWIEWNLGNYESLGFGLWALELKETGEFIGDCGITMQKIDRAIVPEIGYHVRRDMWNRGYATEAARACRDWIFTHTPFGRVYSYMNAENLASRAVAEHNGMTLTGRYRDGEEDLTVYAITRGEWMKRTL